jgi:hypothetical protein
MNLLAAATTEPQRGWGGPVALVATALIFWVFTGMYRRFKEARQATSGTPSSRPTEITVSTVKPQVTATVDSENRGGGPSTAVVVRPAPAVAQQRTPVEEFVALRLGQMTTTQLVREAKKVLNVSDATAWRAVRKARKEQS